MQSLIDIILIAALVIFIITRFSGMSKLPTDKDLKNKKRNKENVVNFPHGTIDMPNEAFKKPEAPKKPANYDDLSGLERIKAMDKSFNEKDFLSGAQEAYVYYYELITNKDEETLDGFVSPKLFDRVMEDIETMDEANLTRKVDVASIEDVVLLDARLNGMTAIIDVKYKVSQSDYVVNDNGDVEEGFSTEPHMVETVWTWARNINSDDPNWELEEISNIV